MANSIRYSDRRYTVRNGDMTIVTGDAMAAHAQLDIARQRGMTVAPSIYQIGTTVAGDWLREDWIALSDAELTECARRSERERYHGAVYAG